MKHPIFRSNTISLLLAGATASLAAAAAAQDVPTQQILPTVKVQAEAETTEQSGSYAATRSSSATGLDLATRDTPQSVSTVTRAQMDDFKLNSVNDALDAVTGVVVERVETDRFYYTARGFDIMNFQVDGIGIPAVWGNINGDLDTAIYDRVDVIRGATGLVSGVGNPSATVNFVRKRPTRDLQASAGVTYGSWNDKRVEADVSGTLNAAGSLRGRAVVAHQDRDSYLDFNSSRKAVMYGIVEADLGRNTLLSLGHTQQNNRPKGVMWGALPLYYTNGQPTDYDVSTSNSAEWTYWNTDTKISFAELQHQFANGWQAKAVLTHKDIAADSKLLYMFGTPVQGTNAGLFAWPSIYTMSDKQDLLDLRANGPFSLGGREHELVLGLSASRSKLRNASTYGDSLFAPVPDPFGGSFPEPTFNNGSAGGSYETRQRSLYAATRLQATDKLKLILGANHTALESKGLNYGARMDRQESDTTPYAGMVFELTPETSLYGSYTKIFRPQAELGADLQPLAPATGVNTEMGIKAELFGKRLNAAFSLFKARQDNLAEYAYFDAANNADIYRGVDTRSRGYEAELSGEAAPGVKLSAGYTRLSIEDDAGDDVRTFTPRQMLRAAATWQARADLKLGAKLSWRSGTSRDQGGGIVTRQSAFALLDLMAEYRLDRQWTAALNLNNVTDRKYLSSLYWSQSFYAPPRSLSVSLNWKY